MNLTALLSPIEGPSPSGEDLSFSADFDQIAELRRQDDPTLSQGAWVTALKVADWPAVVSRCETLLAQRTKDLRLTMWLTEALAITRGFEGLAQGLGLCHDLCERFWDTLHPLPDGPDMEQRVGNMAWLLQRLVTLVPTRPVTQGRNATAYTLQDLAAAQHLHTLQERSAADAARQAEDKISLDQFMRALRDTPRPWLAAQLHSLQQAQDQLLRWQALIDTRLGADGPSFVQAKEALAAALAELTRLAREMGALTASAAASATASSPAGTPPATHLGPASATADAAWHDAAQPGHPGAHPGSALGPVSSRAQALQQLRDVAAFFRHTEPHSPVAYLADKAVAWAEMPLHEWLRRVVKDPGSMSHLQELLGLEPPDSTPPAY